MLDEGGDRRDLMSSEGLTLSRESQLETEIFQWDLQDLLQGFVILWLEALDVVILNRDPKDVFVK